MRVCLFGGTFDPPHIGHLLIAQTVFEAENFDTILFVPANKQLQKKVVTDKKKRIKMLELAIKDNPNFKLSDIEINRGGISYTIDTITHYRNNIMQSGDELFFLIGSDSLMDFPNWKNPEGILKHCKVVVAIRPGFRPSDIPTWILQKVQFANVPRFEISSSIIRKRWKEDKTIRYMVTLPVWEYIDRKNLYI